MKERSSQRVLVVDVAPVVHTILLECVHSDAHIAHHLDSHVQPWPVKESEVGGACRWEAPESHECQATRGKRAAPVPCNGALTSRRVCYACSWSCSRACSASLE